jgi:hypothetical protein
MYMVFSQYSPSHMLSPSLSHWYETPNKTFSTLLFSDFVKEKKMTFLFVQEGRTDPAQGDCWFQWEWGGAGKGGRRINMMQILCIYVCKCKNDTC